MSRGHGQRAEVVNWVEPSGAQCSAGHAAGGCTTLPGVLLKPKGQEAPSKEAKAQALSFCYFFFFKQKNTSGCGFHSIIFGGFFGHSWFSRPQGLSGPWSIKPWGSQKKMGFPALLKTWKALLGCLPACRRLPDAQRKRAWVSMPTYQETGNFQEPRLKPDV